MKKFTPIVLLMLLLSGNVLAAEKEMLRAKIDSLKTLKAVYTANLSLIDTELDSLLGVMRKLDFEELQNSGMTIFIASDGWMKPEPSGFVAGEVKIPKGSKVKATYKFGSYWEIQHQGKIGYISDLYVVQGNAQKREFKPLQTMVTQRGAVSLYSDRTESSSVVKTVNKGEKFYVRKQEAGWIFVTHYTEFYHGWINQQSLVSEGVYKELRSQTKANRKKEIEQAKREAYEALDDFGKFEQSLRERGIDQNLIESVGKSSRNHEAKITVSNAWHVLHKQVRLQMAQNLWKIWTSVHTTDTPDHARILLVDYNGNEVGGSRALAGSMIWVQD